jgi:histidinol dehydrogenase
MAERRLTRSELAHLTSSPQKPIGQTSRKRGKRRVQSVFDLHCLEKIQALFEVLDECRRHGAEQLKQRVEEYVRSASGESLQPTSSSSAATSLSERLRNDLLQAARAQAPMISAGKRRTMQLELLKKDIYVILEKFEMRRWECLIPDGSYPLPQEAMEKASPASLAGR